MGFFNKIIVNKTIVNMLIVSCTVCYDQRVKFLSVLLVFARSNI